MAAPKCPLCGSPMVLRVARKGINAGNKFYGCSRYPACKGIIDYSTNYDETDGNNSTNKNVSTVGNDKIFENDYDENIDDNENINDRTENFYNSIYYSKNYNSNIKKQDKEIAKNLFCRPKFKDFQVKFFENTAFTANILGKIYSEENEDQLPLLLSQFRLDFPVNKNENNFTDKERQIISVLEKILTRGRLTLISPWIEEKFENLYEPAKIVSISAIAKKTLSTNFQKAKKKIWLDTEEEYIFYENILPQLFGYYKDNYQQFVFPKIEISNLIPSSSISDSIRKNQKLDFAIFHPDLNKDIVVQIEEDYEDIESYSEIDKVLNQYDYHVIHLTSKEIREKSGENLSDLILSFSNLKNSSDPNESDLENETINYINIFKIIYQIQISILNAIQSGYLTLRDKAKWYIFTDINNIDLFDNKMISEILSSSVLDFIELLKKLCKIYSFELSLDKPIFDFIENANINELKINNLSDAIFISFSDKFTINIPTFYIQNIYFPFHIKKSRFSAPPIIEGLEKPEEKDLIYFLQYIFRKPYFFEGQFEAITRIFQSKDTLLLLPTGAGKSLVYQLSSLLLPGITMVIDPIISLMEDQMDNLSIMGIDSCIAISSNIRDSSIRTEIIKIMGDGEYYFVFLSPERFQTVQFRQSLRTLTVGTPVSLIVIDEAHCVSEWGHDFRTAYLNIGRNSREFCKYENFIPPVIGLTGTASRSVLKDIQRELQIEDFDAIITPKTFDRKELKFHVIPCTSKEKIPKLKGILSQKLPNLFNTSTSTFFEPLDKNTYSGLIFCQHVGGNYGIINVSNYIKNELYIPVDIYSGKNPKYSDEDRWKDHKTTVTKNFKRNKIPLLVCTKAFGMGIDKPNIRYTIHFGIPASIESFYQESGRAGRDKKTAHCFIIVSNDDKKRSEKLLNPNTTVEEICETEKNLTIEEHDDITRVLYFHTNSFIGIENEKKEIRQVLMQIGDPSKKQEKTINFSSIYRNGIDEEQNVNPRLTKEKAVHRLLTIGVISDYTIDYSRNIFSLQLTGATKQQIITSYGNYIGSYLLSRKEVEVEKASQFLNLEYIDFVLKIVELLLNFIYDVIEKGRRRAIQEMLLACEGRSFFNNAVDDSIDKFIRSRILRYLEATQYSEILEKILEAQDAGLIRSKEIMDNVLSSNDAAELRGQVTRYLESYPDHPALLMLRSLSEIYCRDKNNEIVKQNFLASISSSKTQYGLKDYIVYEYASWGISKIYNRDIICASALINELIKDSDRFHIRLFISKLEPEFAGIPAWLLLKKLADSCAFLLFKKGE